MNKNQTIFEEVCTNSIYCQNDLCQLDHSRIYVGVCIDLLRAEQQFYNDGGEDFKQLICNNSNCNLYHFNEEKFNNLKSGITINGIFPHNLCRQDCKFNCNYIHREWAQNVCLNNIVKICRNKNCKFEHKEWQSLKEKAKACSKIQFITPEEIFSKDKYDCGKYSYLLKDYCNLYIQGLCRNKKCQKNHIDWENIDNKMNQTNSLKSCIVIAQERKKQIQTTSDEVQLFCKQSEFFHYQKRFDQQNIIDVVFIMDLTESMKQWKEHMQNTMDTIIDKFIKSINGYQVRVAFVGYRDICDKEDQIVYWSFTKKIDELKNFIKGLEAKGGGDYAEDIVSGFKQAFQLNFSHHEDSLLCTFLLADAPCHGKAYHKYHNFQSDNQFDKMPNNYFEDVLEKYKKIKKNNFLCCIKINDTTDIMFEKMQKAFPMLTITTKKQPEDLSELVKFTLLESVTKSIQNNQQTNQEYEYQKANFIKFKLDTFTDKYESDYFWKSFLEFCQTRNGETGLKVYKKKLNILDDNSSTYIFKAFDSINNREVIIKIPKKYVDNQKQFTNEEISRDEELAETRFYSSCYACQMAYFFNQRLKENNLLKEMQPLFYAHPILYTLSKPLYGMKKVYGETFIQIQQYKFQKYSNNSKYIDPQKYFYSSFSHFSFEVSKENLVIMDLQGAHNILSDPSIQTEESWISILIKDPTNRFNNGIFDFKTAQHKECSYLCEKLKLHKINQNTKYNQTLCPPNQIKNMYGICYDCDEFISFNEELLNDKNNNKFTFNCKFCSDSMSQKKIDVFCTCCQYMFQTSINNQLKQLTNVGICQDCKNICEKQIVTCYYCRRKCKKIMTDITLNNQTFDICKDAYDYLQAFTCNKCKKSYNQKSIISKEDYEKNTFTCC